MTAKRDILNTIVVTSSPVGRFIEGYVYGTPKPGTIMQIKPGTAEIEGKHTWQVYTPGADGDRPIGPIAVLREDYMQGKTIDDAYVSGTRCFLYVPIPGDELLCLVAKAGTGTGDAQTVTQKYIVENSTGLLIATTGTPETEPFVALEAVSDVTATGTLVWVMYTGY